MAELWALLSAIEVFTILIHILIIYLHLNIYQGCKQTTRIYLVFVIVICCLFKTLQHIFPLKLISILLRHYLGAIANTFPSELSVRRTINTRPGLYMASASADVDHTQRLCSPCSAFRIRSLETGEVTWFQMAQRTLSCLRMWGN